MSDGLPPLREVVAAHGLAAKKSLGQNFLFDLNLTAKIARAAGPLTDATIVEIGPGPGGLTRALLAEGAAHVAAIERDARCIAALGEIAARHLQGWPVLSPQGEAQASAAAVASTRQRQVAAVAAFEEASAAAAAAAAVREPLQSQAEPGART